MWGYDAAACSNLARVRIGRSRWQERPMRFCRHAAPIAALVSTFPIVLLLG